MKKLMLLCVMLFALAGCSGSHNEEPDVTYTTLVTYIGTDRELQVSTFTYQTIDDSPLITLTANWLPEEGKIKPGERVLLVYQADAYGVDGPVKKLIQVAPVIGWLPAKTDKPELGTVSITPITTWRSGPYLNANIEAIMTRDAATAKFALLESTANDPEPVYYFSVTQSNVNEIEAIRRIAVISFDISDSWNRPDCTGVKVIYRDTQGSESSFKIAKNKP